MLINKTIIYPISPFLWVSFNNTILTSSITGFGKCPFFGICFTSLEKVFVED